MWLMKVKESQQFQFFASYAIGIHANEFQPTNKAAFICTTRWGLSFFSFVRGTNLFSVSKFICSPKKESEKLKNSHFGQIHVQFVLFTVSYWVSAMNEHSLWMHVSQLSHWTALWPFRTAPLQRPQSALQFVLRHQIQFLRVRCHQGLGMKRGSVFRIPHIEGVYPMPYSIKVWGTSYPIHAWGSMMFPYNLCSFFCQISIKWPWPFQRDF